MGNQELVRGLLDAEVLGTDGEKLGRVRRVFLDDETGQPAWITVHTGLLGLKENFVPLSAADVSEGRIRVPYGKDKIKDSPSLDADDDRISPDEEAELYRYYGQPYPSRSGREELPDTGVGGRHRGGEAGRATDDAMTRSEERLDVGTERRETGRVRLRKYVVTEHEQQSVPVRREEVRVEREPISEANVDKARSGPDLSEAEAEVTLHEERPVVEKTVEPVERVRLATDEVTGEEQVSEPVRKERIEVEGEGLDKR
jgi:uncharacterized protein (TIGR02271 family)